MNGSLRALATSAVVFSLCACGDADKRTNLTDDVSSQQQALTEPEAGIIEALGFDAERLGPDKNTAECASLRIKLASEKSMVRWTSDWRTLERTPAYRAFLEDKEKFNGAKCAYAAPLEDQIEECKVLLNRIHAGWDKIFSSPEWPAVAANATFQKYQYNLGRAKKLGCFLP